ncbi:MAG TPA: PAS domain S-box protein [Hyphomicrobiaceae bacterium]|nr:PAS domain S-box protein [Hyphomicrobiaceae bacterium]
MDVGQQLELSVTGNPEDMDLQAAEGRSRSQLEWRQLVDLLPAAVYTTDADGRITYYNQAAAELWGRRPTLGEDSWCGTWRLYWLDGRPMRHDECPMALTLATGCAVRGKGAIAERPDGKRFPFLAHPTPLRDAQGRTVGAVNMLVDMTDYALAEADRQRLTAIVESSDDAIISKDLDGIVTTWNPGAERLFGYTAEEMIGRSITTIIPADRRQEEPAILQRVRRGERVGHYDAVRVRKDGTLVDISLTVSPIRDASGRIIGASKIARDISERKRAEERQELLTRELHHRTQNLFAVVQSVVARSFVGKRTVADAESTVMSRLRSLAQAHALLAEREWQCADLAELARIELRPYADRVTIDGPTVMLAPQAAQMFALALHELATNAVKYGALSNLAGRVRIEWSVIKPNGHRRLTFRWRETGDPPVAAPSEKGFGSAILERAMGEYFDAPPRIDFAEHGVGYELSGPLEAVSIEAWQQPSASPARSAPLAAPPSA